MPRHLALPSSAFDDVRTLLRLEEGKLRALADLFGTSASVPAHTPAFIREVAEQLHLDVPTVESIVLVCQFLLTVVEDGSPPQEILNDVRAFVVQHASAEEDVVGAFDSKRKLLESVLTPKPARSRALKVQYLAHGLHPTADSFRTVCELRPVFECPEGREVIIGYVPAIFVEVKLSDKGGDEETLLFQLTPDKLKSLKEVIARTEEKLTAIRAKFGKELLGE